MLLGFAVFKTIHLIYYQIKLQMIAKSISAL